MKRCSLLIVGLLAAAAGLAATATVTWNNPTLNTDNSAIPASGAGSIASSRVEYGTCVGTGAARVIGTKLGEIVTNSPATTAVSPDLGPGTYCFTARVTNTYGVESDATPTAVKVVAAPKPNPPSNFSVN